MYHLPIPLTHVSVIPPVEFISLACMNPEGFTVVSMEKVSSYTLALWC